MEVFIIRKIKKSRNNEGTGFKLSSTKKFTKLHGGAIEVQSEVDKGSKFTISLNK